MVSFLGQYDFGQAEFHPIVNALGEWYSKEQSVSDTIVITNLQPGARFYVKTTPFVSAINAYRESSTVIFSGKDAILSKCGCAAPPACPVSKSLFAKDDGGLFCCSDVLTVSGSCSTTNYCCLFPNVFGCLGKPMCKASFEPSWETDGSGQPEYFAAIQELGFVRFSWVDASMCEDAFSFARNGIFFIEDYSNSAADACGVSHAPELQRDDISAFSPALGQSIEYCISAVSILGMCEIPTWPFATCCLVITLVAQSLSFRYRL